MNSEGKKEFLAQLSNGSESSGTSTTHSLEELSSPEFFSHQCREIDAMASRVIDENSIRQAISSAVDRGPFCVTIADPRYADVPLIAVSDAFEQITGFCRSEALGKNCRFLNEGCVLDRLQLIRLRSACETGASFSGVLTNRRKSGELFLNLLDVRGLTVARNPHTGEELWFLVGIQADVTSAHLPKVQEEQLARVQLVANAIRARLTAELSALAVAGALASSFAVCSAAPACGAAAATAAPAPPNAWCLLPQPLWRCGGALPDALAEDPEDCAAAGRRAAGSAPQVTYSSSCMAKEQQHGLLGDAAAKACVSLTTSRQLAQTCGGGAISSQMVQLSVCAAVLSLTGALVMQTFPLRCP